MNITNMNFLAACRTGNVEAVQYFLQQEDFDPNEQIISGLSKTPVSGLFLAAQNGYHKVVEILVAAEADLNLTLKNGATAFFVAAEQGQLDVVNTLLEAGAHLNQARNDGATALSMAAQKRPPQCS